MYIILCQLDKLRYIETSFQQLSISYIFGIYGFLFFRNFFLIDCRHKHLQNTIDLLLFYGELESDLMKMLKKNYFATTISIDTGHRHLVL